LAAEVCFSLPGEIDHLSAAELQRLFLGMPVTRHGQSLRALVNRSDDRSYQIFLQAVMGMSAPTYQRRLLGRLYRKGIQPPPVVEDFEALLAAVKESPGTVTYVLAGDLPDDPELRVVQELWRGAVR